MPVLDPHNSRLLQHWVNPGGPGTPIPRGQIVMLNQAGAPIRRYNFFEAWPSKWPGAGADGSKTIELAVGRLTRG